MTEPENPTPSPDAEGYFSEEVATFGDRVAAARRVAGLPQEALSQKLGIKLKTLRAWEDDMSEPRANKLQMLAGVLNVSIIWLLTGKGDGIRISNPDIMSLSSEQAEIVAEMQAVADEVQRLSERIARLQQRLNSSYLS